MPEAHDSRTAESQGKVSEARVSMFSENPLLYGETLLLISVYFLSWRWWGKYQERKNLDSTHPFPVLSCGIITSFLIICVVFIGIVAAVAVQGQENLGNLVTTTPLLLLSTLWTIHVAERALFRLGQETLSKFLDAVQVVGVYFIVTWLVLVLDHPLITPNVDVFTYTFDVPGLATLLYVSAPNVFLPLLREGYDLIGGKLLLNGANAELHTHGSSISGHTHGICATFSFSSLALAAALISRNASLIDTLPTVLTLVATLMIPGGIDIGTFRFGSSDQLKLKAFNDGIVTSAQLVVVVGIGWIVARAIFPVTWTRLIHWSLSLSAASVLFFKWVVHPQDTSLGGIVTLFFVSLTVRIVAGMCVEVFDFGIFPLLLSGVASVATFFYVQSAPKRFGQTLQRS